MKQLFFIFSFFMCIVSFAQTNDRQNALALFEKVQTTYESNNSYSLFVKYEMFSNATSKKIEESYRGKIIKKDENYYSKIHNTEFIQFKADYVKINHDEKAMVYAKGLANTDMKDLINIASFLEYFKNINMRTTDDFIVCELSLEADKITMSPYSKVVLYINKEKHTLEKQVLYMLQATPFRNEKGQDILSNPRLEISFSNFQAAPNEIDQFKVDSYVSITKGQIQPSSELKGYHLIDITNN